MVHGKNYPSPHEELQWHSEAKTLSVLLISSERSLSSYQCELAGPGLIHYPAERESSDSESD